VQLRYLLDAETRLAREDTLTHVPKRLKFFELGRRALAQARREGTPITAAFIDLDRLKEVNDKRGRAASDALLLPGMDGASAKTYIEDLRHRLLRVFERLQCERQLRLNRLALNGRSGRLCSPLDYVDWGS